VTADPGSTGIRAAGPERRNCSDAGGPDLVGRGTHKEVEQLGRMADVRIGNSVYMIILGLVLLLIGVLVGIPILYTLGVVLLIVGLVLMLLGRSGTAFAGRRHYW